MGVERRESSTPPSPVRPHPPPPPPTTHTTPVHPPEQSLGRIHVTAFCDELLHAEVEGRASFFTNPDFYGVDLSCLQRPASLGYFGQVGAAQAGRWVLYSWRVGAAQRRAGALGPRVRATHNNLRPPPPPPPASCLAPRWWWTRSPPTSWSPTARQPRLIFERRARRSCTRSSSRSRCRRAGGAHSVGRGCERGRRVGLAHAATRPPAPRPPPPACPTLPRCSGGHALHRPRRGLLV